MEVLSKSQIDQLKQDIDAVIKDIDIPSKKSRIGELETLTLAENFWQDQQKAKETLAEIERLKRDVEKASDLENGIKALTDLYEISNDQEKEQLINDYNELNEKFAEFERLKYLSGKYDKANAIISIHAGQGGTEADDWVEMLLRMYNMYFDKKGWKATVENIVRGNETGISTVTLTVEGDYAFGLLKYEKGVHRLVRLSPFNAQNLRQTSFAGVEVMPVIEDSNNEIEIPESDIEFKAVRASGPGGQHVNKTSSAVQITHIPTGITVHSSEQRSQSQNRDTAMRILKAKLWTIEQEKQQEEINKIKGDHKIAGWGNQIRNYVLHPYKLVKDLRTDIESSNPEAVLDGNLDQFIDAEIRIK